jgi:hypothetical protein
MSAATAGAGDTAAQTLWRRVIGVFRPGSRVQRKRASHTYGFALLLICVLFLFIAAAPDRTWAACFLITLAAVTLMSALWTSGLQQGRPIYWIIAGITGAASIALVAADGPTTLTIAGVLEVAFLGAACAAILSGIVDQGRVNGQSVLGAICVYLCLGLVFTFLYGAAAQVDSGTFFAQGTNGSPSIRLYFSFVTLATLGYGDYTPAQTFGHMAAVVEALIGQLYLVTVVALLVANLGRRSPE